MSRHIDHKCKTKTNEMKEVERARAEKRAMLINTVYAIDMLDFVKEKKPILIYSNVN